MTRKYSTSEAILILELHPKWVFLAPETDDWKMSKLSSDGAEIYAHRKGPDSFDGSIQWITSDSIPPRNDWTLFRPKKVRRERVNMGECSGAGTLGLCGMLDGPVGAIDCNGHYDIYAVKR